MRTNLYRRLLVAGALALGMAAAPVAAHAQFGIPGVPQIVIDPRNLVQNARQVAQAAQQIDNQRRQILYQIQALQRLRNPNWRELSGLVNQLDQIMRQGQALAYSAAQIDRLFQQTFPGYQLPADLRIGAAQRQQAERSLATLRASLNAVSRQMADAQPGLARLGQIKRQMNGIVSPQQALELQNTLQGYAAEELVMLRQAISIQTNAQAVAEAARLQRQMQADAALEQLLRNTVNRRRTTSPGTDGSWRRP
jgi:P-type conjugative transfer protein TrbJ